MTTLSPEAQKAQGLMLEAKRRQESFSWPWSGNSKHEEAAELYKKAANLFKLSKEWDQAGYAFVKTAECFVLLQSKHEVAENYINASNCFKKSDIQAAIRYLKMGIEFYIDEGRFSIAGRHQKKLRKCMRVKMIMRVQWSVIKLLQITTKEKDRQVMPIHAC